MPYNPAKPPVFPEQAPWQGNLQPKGYYLDLNTLVFSGVSHSISLNHVFRVGPSTIDVLKGIVEDFAEAWNPELIRKNCGSTRTRFEIMKKAGDSIALLFDNQKCCTIN